MIFAIDCKTQPHRQNENKTAWTCLSASSSAAVRKTCGRQKCIDPCVVNSSLMLQLQLANSHSSWGQVLSDCYIKTNELLKSRTHLTSFTSLMCGMCRIMTWPSLGSQYESPNRGSMRHNTTVPAGRSVKWKTVFRISILLSVQKSVFAKSFHNACIRSTHHLHHKMWNNPYETWWIGPK